MLDTCWSVGSEFKNLTVPQTIERCLKEINNFKNLDDISSALTSIFGELNISIPQHRPPNNKSSRQTLAQIFSDLQNIKFLERSQYKYLNAEKARHLSSLLAKYPDHHYLIWRACNISKSTYQRVIKEVKQFVHEGILSRRMKREKKELCPIEKKYIKVLIHPPRTPITLKDV